MRMTRSPSRVALMCVAWLAILLLTTSVSGFVILEVSTSAAPTERADIYKGYQAAIGTYSTSFTLSSSVVAAGAGAGAAVVAAAGAVSAAAVIGLYDDAAIASVPNKLGSYVLFGPYPQSLAVRQWSNQLYFMTADPTGELLSLLNQAVIRDIAGTTAMGTVGWMYLKGVAGATTEPLSTTFYAQINQLGYNTPVAYTADASSAFTSAATFLALKPTSIFIFGERGAHTTAFVAAVGTSPVSSGTGFTAFAPFALLNSISGGSGSLTASKMVFTSLVPPPKSTTLATASAAAFTTAITASNTGMAGTYLASVSGLYAFHGWIAMMQAIYAVNLYGSTTGLNTASLQTALFMQNRYVIGNDYILGDYGGSCGNSVVGVATGTACQCNQGGHYVAVITVAGGAVTMVNEKNYPLYDCYISGTAEGTAPLRVSMFGLTDVAALNYIYTQMNNGFTAVSAAGAAATYQLQSQMTMKYASMATATSATAATTLTTQATNFMSVVSGPLPSGFSPATYPNILFLEPIFVDSGALSLTLNNVIYVTATLEQQIYIMSSYIADRIKAIPKPKPGAANNQQQTELRTVNAVVRTANPATLFKLIESSVNQFGLPLNNQTVATAADNMVDELGENGFFFVIGIASNEIPDLLTFMTKNLDVVVFLCFNDITLQYATFESTFKTAPNAVTRRLFFVTDIITWSATTNAADIVEKYLSTASTTYQTPAGARGFLAAVALDRATAGIPNANAQTIFNNFMNVQSFSIGNNAYGPYHSNCFTAPSDYPSACLKNYGARNMALMQWRNLQDLNYPLPILRSSPSLVYTAGIVTTTTTTTTTLPPCTHRPRTRKPAPKHSGMIAGLIFLCLLLLLLLLLVLWLCWISCFCCASTDSQNVKAAPTDATKPVTMAYISVYKWSEVSSAAPEAASQAISDVRNLVRRVVAKNNCYEVGTLNDAFIVAARVAMNGVQMAIDLQNGLRELGGAGQADIDRAYYSILKEGPGSGKGAMHGLRLRVGLHTDQVDIKMDRATGVYQYRGPGVILSAFTSRLAHGGQILLTENTCNSLTELELTKLDTLPIGAHKYPDMNEPVNVYEVVAVPGRKHPAARPETVPTHTADLLSELPLVCATFKDAEDEETSANTGQLNKTIQVVLRILYSTFPAADRVELLQHLCREASLKELKRPTNASDEDFSNALIDLLAMRAATFVITAADVTRATGNMDAMNATTPGKGVETFSPNGTEMHQYEDPQKPPQQDEYSYPTDNNDERAGGHNAPLADVSDATSDSSMFHL